MAKTKEINRDMLKSLRVDLDKALDGVAKKYGVKMSLGTIRFTPESAQVKLSVFTVSLSADDVENVMTADAKNFQLSAFMYGLKGEWLFKSFVFPSGRLQGHRLQIVGLRDKMAFGKMPKYPVLVKDLTDGKHYKYPVDLIKRFSAILDKE